MEDRINKLEFRVPHRPQAAREDTVIIHEENTNYTPPTPPGNGEIPVMYAVFLMI